ncbi:MAG TPA: hypothetical protein VN029_05225 [Sphingomonas sp.]|nr:hypothetical protein [Sphingomonas sp.]
MINSLPQSAKAPFDPRLPGDTRNGQDQSDLFAQLLGASNVAQPALDMPEQRGDQDAVPVAISVPESAIAQQPETHAIAPAPLARVFNQDGFFGQGVAGESVAAVVPESPDAECALLQDPGENGIGIGLEDAGFVSGGGEIAGPRSAAFATTAAHRAGHGQGARAYPSLVPASGQPHAASPAAGPEAEALEVHPVRRLFRGVLAAQSPVQVAVDEVEQGLRVTARVAGLDETERRQLREEIAALLARHGLVSSSIQINVVPVRGNEK